MGLSIKLQRPGIFYKFRNYFPTEKSIDQVYGAMDQVHGWRSTRSTTFIKYESSVDESMAEISFYERVR
jgi:hypothetical protein